VSAVRGSLKSVLDFAVEEVLEDAGYKVRFEHTRVEG